MTDLSAMDIKLLFTHAELEVMNKMRNDSGLNAIFRIIDDQRFTTINILDSLFIDSINHLYYLQILNSDRKTRVLQGLRPL
jgi:hypothetical protein